MKNLAIYIFFLTSTIAYGQLYEEKIAKKACQCISKEIATDNLDELMRKCIISSQIDVDSNDPSEKENRQFTVEGIRKIYNNVSTLLVEKCPALRTKVSEQKKLKYYKVSKNQKANEYFDKANEFRDKNQFEFAIEHYIKAIQEDKEFVMAYDLLGMAYRMNNDLDNAIKTYNNSLQIFPEGDFSLLNIAAAYSIKENDTEARKYYDKLIGFYPENAEGYYGSGRTNLILGNNEIALRNTLYSVILFSNQNSDKISDAKTLLGFIHSKMKKDNELEKFNQITKEFNIQFKE
jgi:tetratricopeptide (TPR) repeat protein